MLNIGRRHPREHPKGTSDQGCAHPREPRRVHLTLGHYGLMFHNVTSGQKAHWMYIAQLPVAHAHTQGAPEGGHVTFCCFR
jgi:hypothetical protein